jgi:hypothetical protein
MTHYYCNQHQDEGSSDMGAVTANGRALLEEVESWPVEDQEELLQYAREIQARRSGVYPLSDAERTGIERGLQAMREGRFASDEEIAEIFKKARSRLP